MKNKKYFAIVFFIFTLFNGSCSDTFVEEIELKFCGKCANTGLWTVNSLDFSPCFSTEVQCLDWAKKNGYSDKGCVFCD